MIHHITPAELRSWIENKAAFTLIDVREPYEHEEFNIGGLLIPLDELSSRSNEIPTDQPIVFYCRKGIRSVIAAQKLSAKLPQTTLYNLSGGMEAWQRSGN